MKCLNCGSEIELHAAKCPQCEVAIRWKGSEPEFLHPAAFVPVYTGRDANELPVIESLLLANNIPFVVSNDATQDIVGLGRMTGYNLALGPPVVRVHESDVAAARDLIASAGTPVPVEDDGPGDT